MFNKKSDYSLNKKDRGAIVYTDVNQQTVRLTRNDFDSEEEFIKWKAWSDENYHQEELREHIHADHSISSTELVEVMAQAPSPEFTIEQRIEKQEKDVYCAETVIRIRGKISEKQFRRIWMRYVEGMEIEAIAKLEGRAHSSVSESISRAKKKINELFSKNPT